MKTFLIFIFASFACTDLRATIVADSPEYQSFHFDKSTMISKKINKAKVYKGRLYSSSESPKWCTET